MPSYIASSAYPESTRSYRSSHEHPRHSPTASIGSRRSRSVNGTRSAYYDRGAYTQAGNPSGSGYTYGSNQPYGYGNQAYYGDTDHRGHHYHVYPQQQQQYYSSSNSTRHPRVVYAPSEESDRRHGRRYSTGSAYYVAPSTAGSSHRGRQVQYAYPESQHRDYGNNRRELHYVSDHRMRERGHGRAHSSSPTLGERLKWLFGMGHKSYHDSGKQTRRSRSMHDSGRRHDDAGRHIYAV